MLKFVNLLKLMPILAFNVSIGGFSLDFGAGPSWINLIWIDNTTYRSNDNLIRRSVYDIKKSVGFTIDTTLAYEINDYFKPNIEYTYINIRRGHGTLDVYNILNSTDISIFEQLTFKPTITANAVIVGNEFKIKDTTLADQELGISGILAYGYNTFKLISKYPTEISESDTTANSFVGTIKFDLKTKYDFNLAIMDNLYLTKLKTITTPDGELGTDAGMAFYNLVGNNITLAVVREIREKLSASLAFGYTHYKNFGQSKIVLSAADLLQFKNPKLCSTKLNEYTLVLYLSASF